MAYQSKNHRKFLATSLTAAMVASAVAPAVSAASFPDVKDDNFYASYVNQLADAGIIEGMPNGTFGLREKVTRAQAAKMVSLIRGLDTANAPAASFEDVKQDAWYADYINALYAEKLVDGVSETEFAPNGTLTRAQFAKLVVDAYGLELKPETKTPFTDVKEGVWYTDYVKTLYANKLINGKTATTFEPNSTIDRADFAKLLVDADLEFGFTLGKASVTGVSATNPTTLTLTGTGLKNLKAEDLTIEGNKVTSVTSADGKTATVVLEKALVPSEEYTLKVKQDDQTKDFTFKFEYNVTKVDVTTTLLDDDLAGQKVEFTVNGEKADLDFLTNIAGYKVAFQASEDVFKTATTTPSDNSTTGVIDAAAPAVAINKSFTVKVVLTKGGDVYQSEEVTVNVANLNATPAIGELAITNYGGDAKVAGTAGTADEDFLMNSNKLLTTEKAVVSGVYSKTGDVIAISGGAVYKSSNEKVAMVSNQSGTAGEITPVGPGKTTITVTAGTVTYSYDLEVVNGVRKVSKFVPKASSLNLAPGATATVTGDLYDQYGDPIVVEDATTADELTVTEASSSSYITFSDLSDGSERGKVTMTVTAENASGVQAPTGNYSVYLKNSNNVAFSTLPVKVTSDNVVATSKTKLVSVNGKNTVSGNGTLTLELNEYTTNGGFVSTLAVADPAGAATTGLSALEATGTDASATEYTVEVADSSVATLGVDANDNVVIEGVKAGTTKVVVKRGALTNPEVFNVTVTDDAIRVTEVDFLDELTVTTKGYDLSAYDVLDIVDSADGYDSIVKGLKLSEETTSYVRVDAASFASGTATIYLDTNDNGDFETGSSTGHNDTVLGTLTTVLSPDATFSLNADLTDLRTTAEGDKGTIVFQFNDTVSSPSKLVGSSTVKVNVK